MQDFYDQIVELWGSGEVARESVQPGSAWSAQWLEFPGCVAIRGGFGFDTKTDVVLPPSLFICLHFDSTGEGASGSAHKEVAGETKISVVAVREPGAVGETIRRGESFAIGLAFAQGSIGGLGLEKEFLALFKESRAKTTVASLKATPRIQAIAAEMFSASLDRSGAQLLLRAHAAEILVYTLFNAHGQVEPDLAVDQKRIRLQSVKDQIDADPGYPWSIPELARRAGLSHRSLNQQFQMVYGESAIDYLRNKRLDAARDILLHQRLSVTETAYRVGYAHPANFATAFRRRFGHSPSRCR